MIEFGRTRSHGRPGNVLIAAMLLLTPLAGCERAKGEKKSAAPPAPPPPAVVVAEVTQRTVPLVRDFTARTEAVPTVEVRARVAGVLEQVLFQEGSEIKQGQTMFVIQREEYAASVDSARAQVAKAEADLLRARDASVIDRSRATLDQRKADLEKAGADVARYQPLVEARAIPKQDLDTAQSQEKVAQAGVVAAEAALKDTELLQRTQIQLAEAAVKAAKASLTQADLNLGYTNVAAPITGIVGKIQVDRGNLVGKNEPTLLATISAVDPIYVDFPVVEADYLRFAQRIRLDSSGRAQNTERRLQLFLADDSEFPQKGRVAFVDRALDPKTGTITVRAEFPNPNKVLRPGQFARVRGVVEERANAILLPQLAVQDQQGTKVVLVVDDGNKVGLRPVVLGERVGDDYIATSGVKPGERVIVEGVQKVRAGMQVKPEARAPIPMTPRPVVEPPKAPAPAKTSSPPPGTPKTGG
jgi:membrane fusion protein (multidrug efflux system)